MKTIAVALICHGPCIHYLPDHLKAIAQAKEEAGLSDMQIGITLSQISTSAQKDKAEIAIKESGLSAEVHYSPDKLTFATARKISADLTTSDWVLFTDVDTIMDRNALKIYSRQIQATKEDVGAVAGGIGVLRQSEYGGFEALWEILTLYRRIQPEFEAKICSSLKDDWRDQLNSVNHLAFEWMGKSREREVPFLQGYNMLIRRDTLDTDSLMDELSGAWDRAMAAYITGPKKLKIVCWPDCLVYHDFDFTLEQIQQRKINHALYTNRVREAFEGYQNVAGSHKPEYWLLDVDTDHPSCPNRNLFPFNTPTGRDYTSAAKIAYAYGCLRSYMEDHAFRPVAYKDHRAVLNLGLGSREN